MCKKIKAATPATLLVFILPWALMNMANADPVTLYSYAKTADAPGNWALMPTNADIDVIDGTHLFEALKNKKLPSYGNSTYQSEKNLLEIDPSKCAYATIISAEISHTFRQFHISVPQMTCAGANVPDAFQSLGYYAVVTPLWLALSNETLPENAIIRTENQYISAKVFEKIMNSQDKQFFKAIDDGLESQNPTEKAALIRTLAIKKISGYEKKIARELASPDPQIANSALEALASSKDKNIQNQLLALLEQVSPLQETRARILLQSPNPKIHTRACIYLLKSQDPQSFSLGLAQVQKKQMAPEIIPIIDDILSGATPEHTLDFLAWLSAIHQEHAITLWLNSANGLREAVQTAALKYHASKNPRLKLAADSLLLQNQDSALAEDAVDQLLTQQNAIHAFMRGILSPHSTIQAESANALKKLLSIPVTDSSLCAENAAFLTDGPYVPVVKIMLAQACSTPVKNAKSSLSECLQLLHKAQNHQSNTLAEIEKNIYDPNPYMRVCSAYALRWGDHDTEKIEKIQRAFLHDSDISVVLALLVGMSDAVMPNTVMKEAFARTANSEILKTALIRFLPGMLSEKNTPMAISFINNEMFDASDDVRTSAIRSLSDIARSGAEPLKDRIVTSLALTSQDKSKTIVYHTLCALRAIKTDAAEAVILRANDAHPELCQRLNAVHPKSR